jgi:hypothetical protein
MKPMDDDEVLMGWLYGCTGMMDRYAARRTCRCSVCLITKMIKNKEAEQFVELSDSPYGQRTCQLFKGRVVWTTTVGVYHPASASMG